MVNPTTDQRHDPPEVIDIEIEFFYVYFSSFGGN